MDEVASSHSLRRYMGLYIMAIVVGVLLGIALMLSAGANAGSLIVTVACVETVLFLSIPLTVYYFTRRMEEQDRQLAILLERVGAGNRVPRRGRPDGAPSRETREPSTRLRDRAPALIPSGIPSGDGRRNEPRGDRRDRPGSDRSERSDRGGRGDRGEHRSRPVRSESV